MSEIIELELSAAAARDLTNRLKVAGAELYDMIWQAHRGKAWQALGYASWNEYVGKELDMSKSRSFQLLQFVQTRQLIGESTTVDLPKSEAHTRPLARLKTVSDKLTAWVNCVRSTKGDPTAAAVEASVEKVMRESSRYTAPPKPIEKPASESGRKEKTPDPNADYVAASTALLKAARLTGIGPNLIRLAKRIKEASPRTFDQLKNGEISIDEAAEETDLTDQLNAAPEVRIQQIMVDALIEEHGAEFAASHLTKDAEAAIFKDASNMVIAWMTAACISVTTEKPIVAPV